MTDRQALTTDRPALGAAEASVFVADLDLAPAFFADKLGFEVGFTYGER